MSKSTHPLNTKGTILEFLHDNDGHKYGVLVASAVNTEARIGFSIVNPTSSDVFNKDFALDCAFDRINKNRATRFPNNKAARLALGEFKKRCARYFKNMPVRVVGQENVEKAETVSTKA